MLVDATEAPVVSDLALPGDSLEDRPVLLIFDRYGPSVEPLAAVRAELPERFAVVLVVHEAPPDAADSADDASVVTDPRAGCGLRSASARPEDGAIPPATP